MGAVRLFLALVVAAGHLQLLVLAPLHLGGPWPFKFGMNAGYAAMNFYMISGFLMSLVLSQKYPMSRGVQYRFIRVVSLGSFVCIGQLPG